MQYNNHRTKEDYENAVKQSYSIANVCRLLGLEPKGSNYKTIHKAIQYYQIDTSHFTGQGWLKNKASTDTAAKVPLSDILQENTNFASANLKQRLYTAGLKQEMCEICGCTNIWMGKPITLELHHINNNHYDNRLENLQILCPNCHSQTRKFRRRYDNTIPKPFNTKKTHKLICQYCHKEFNADKPTRKFCCRDCYNKSLESHYLEKPLNKDELKKQMTICNTIKELANVFNTSTTTIYNYLKKYDLYNEYKTLYNVGQFHSKAILQYDLSLNLIKEWDCISDAVQTLNIKGIDNCLAGKRKSAGGFKWKYKDDI